jgi:hypothetical protein
MQTNEPINTAPIQQLIQMIKSAETGNQKEIRIPLAQAKTLMYSLTTVIANQQGRLEKLIVDNANKGGEETVTISMDGGSGWK